MERYSQNYSFVVSSVILVTQMATKSDVFCSYFVYTVFIPRVTFLVELQIQLHTPVKSYMIINLLKINLLERDLNSVTFISQEHLCLLLTEVQLPSNTITIDFADDAQSVSLHCLYSLSLPKSQINSFLQLTSTLMLFNLSLRYN